MKKIKRIKVNVGTEIIFQTPSHPLSVAMQTKKVIDKIMSLDDTDYEFSCNSREGLLVFQHYGADLHPKEISVSYFINGKKSKFEEALEDLDRGKKYVEQIIGKYNDCK